MADSHGFKMGSLADHSTVEGDKQETSGVSRPERLPVSWTYLDFQVATHWFIQAKQHDVCVQITARHNHIVIE
ncbi:hypothetical protein RUM43_008673 [Polyplax serrata]|uniref:Uncharacterized protein n=1 Tax=Polyplax serrata TaxID=468196 RepID=A0AAN8NU13_POLSC